MQLLNTLEKMNYLKLLLLCLVLNSCKDTPNNISDLIVLKDYEKEIRAVKKYANEHSYNQEIAFMIDYSLHSGKNRFFVVDLKKELISKKGLVCHGSCKVPSKNGSIPKHYSNISESFCTSLGMAVMGERAYSRWGEHYKYWIDGLENSNSNMRKRVVVLHAWEQVPDKEVYPESIAMSWGCPTVSINFLNELDSILKTNKKVLLYSFR